MKALHDLSEGRSGKRNTFHWKLIPSPISMEVTVKSDKTGGAICAVGTGSTLTDGKV